MFPGHVRRSLFTTTFRYCAYYRVTKGFTLLSKKKKSKKKFIFYYRVTIVFTPTVFTTLQHAAEVGCVWACVCVHINSISSYPTCPLLSSPPPPAPFSLPHSLPPSSLSLSQLPLSLSQLPPRRPSKSLTWERASVDALGSWRRARPRGRW